MKRYVIAILFLIPLLGLLTSCDKGETEIVARIGNEKITADEFREKLKQDYRNTDFKNLSLKEKRKSLEKLLDERRKLLKAIALGLDKDPDYAAYRKLYADRVIALALYNDLITNVILPERLLRQYYDWKKQKVKIALVRVGYKGVKIFNRDRSKEEAQALALDYLEQLKQSNDPEKLALELSDDKRNRPILNPYPIGRFGYRIDSLVFTANPGDMIGPENTQQGFVVIKILDKTETPLGKYETVKTEIANIIRGYFRKKEMDMFQQYTNTFNEKYNVQYNEDEIERFMKILKDWGNKKEHAPSDFTPEEREIVLATISDEAITVNDFLNYLGPRIVRDYRKYRKPNDLKEGFLRSQLTVRAWAMEGRSRGYATHKSVQKDIHAFEISRLNQLLEEKEIKGRIEISDEELKAYYNSHKEKYKIPEKIHIWQICVHDKGKAKKVARLARAKNDFESLYRQYNKPHKGKKYPVNLGMQQKNSRYKEIATQAFKAGPHQIIGPVKIEGDYFIIKTGEYRPETIRPFEKVRSSVHSDVFNKKRAKRYEEFLNQLRKEYAFRVNDSVLRKIS